MARHENSGKCEKCADIMNRFGVEQNLRSWFTIMQAKYPEAHVSFAGRTKEEQQELFDHKITNAVFGQSPHNYTPSLAIDIFRLVKKEDGTYKAEFSIQWYKDVLIPEKPHNIKWGGEFKNLVDGPHFEVNGWQRVQGKILIWDKG